MNWLGNERVELDVCDSTNDEAARLASQGAAHGTVVTARAQRAGRGRLGRTWYSPPGENLYLSCVLRPPCEPAKTPPVTLAAGLGVVEAIRALHVRASLKWPNDVLFQGRKLAGVLSEMSTRGARVEHLIVGIGVNLRSERFPPHLHATSLRLAGADVDTRAFMASLLGRLERWFDRFFAGGVAAIAPAWMEYAGLNSSRPDRQVRVTSGANVIQGRATGIDAMGRLQIMTPDGRVHTIMAGEVAEIATGH